MLSLDTLMIALVLFLFGYVANDLLDVPTLAVVATGLVMVIALMVFKQRKPRK